MRTRVHDLALQAWAGAPGWLRAPLWVTGQTFRLYARDNCGTYAAAIAYYALFSIVPLALVVLSFAGLIVDQQQIVDWVFEQVPLQETQSVQDNVDSIVRRTKDISVAGLSFGTVLLIWTGSGIFAAVRRGLNAAGHRQPRPYLHGKLIDLLMVPVFGLLILVAILATVAAQLVIQRGGELGPVSFDANQAIRWSSYGISAAMSLTLFVLLYRFVPAEHEEWRALLPSAAFATLLFELVKNAGALIVAQAPFERETAIYAGFSGIFAFLFWVWINASILLLGAEFGRALALHRQLERKQPAGPSLAPAAPLTPEPAKEPERASG